MFGGGPRSQRWRQLGEPADVLVIGGGIVGAGIAREAARRGWSVVLVEQGDFASGTSSRSSKFVHGGLRYLTQGSVAMTHQSVRAREQLLRHGPGLVEPITFLLAHYAGAAPGLGLTSAALTIYDALGGRRTHRRHRRDEVRRMVPELAEAGLTDCYSYLDARTDDARLTLRVLGEAARAGARVLNYARATRLLRHGERVIGAEVADALGPGQSGTAAAEVTARIVVNATGAWADQLGGTDGNMIRPLRGSHLVFARDQLPLRQAVSITHPDDRRAVVFAPWESVTLVGTTDVDHGRTLDGEPRASDAEIAYLMAAVGKAFPALHLDATDALGCYAGVRPVVSTGKADPSRESREHLMSYRDGLLIAAGGKLTTYHVMARAALASIPPGDLPPRRTADVPLDPPGLERAVAERAGPRLVGRYGAAAAALVAGARPGELSTLPGSPVRPAELRFAARYEAVEHLDDLLMRRVRLGVLEPRGGEEHFTLVEAICREELGWDDCRWSAEVERYRQVWRRSYSING